MEIAHLLPLIYSKLFIYTLAFTRIAAFLNAFILFRRWVVAQRTIISITALLSVYAVMLYSPAGPNNTAASEQIFSLMILQSLLGFIAATILNITFEVFSAAGQIVSSQIGLSMASMFDPRLGSITNITHFYMITAAYVFFALNGHIFMMKEILESFQTMPLDQLLLSKHMLYSVFQYSERIFSSSVLVSMALIFTILIVNLALAFVTKFASQFNIFSVGINITLIVGLAVLYLSFHAYVNFTELELSQGLSKLKHVIARGS